MCTPKQDPKPDPALLGSGMAGSAALAIKNRKKQIDEQLKAAGG